MGFLLADPTLSSRSPGEEFARIVCARRDADDVEVNFGVALTTTFPLAENRPRYTVRHLLKAATVVDEPVRFVSEARAQGSSAESGASYSATPEARFRPTLASTELTELVVDVPLPDGLSDDPALLAAYIDHRVVVRLCTVENEALLRGSADGLIEGLLKMKHLRGRPAPGELDDELAVAAAEVEEMGGSCDGIVAHPQAYWQLVRTGMLSKLATAGVRVSRTRMIEPDRVLLGDMSAALTIVEPGTSSLTLRRGAGENGGDVVQARQRLGLAVHLPQHLIMLERS
jgi:hypothetical protein